LIAGCYPANVEDCPSFIEIGKIYEIDMLLTVKILEMDKKSCWVKIAYKLETSLPEEQAWINLNAYKMIKPE